MTNAYGRDKSRRYTQDVPGICISNALHKLDHSSLLTTDHSAAVDSGGPIWYISPAYSDAAT
jgi:hypothetical protein